MDAMIAEKGFVENGIKNALNEMIDIPFYSRLMEEKMKENENASFDELAFLYWYHNDRDYLLHLSKKLPYRFPMISRTYGTYYLGYYEDGSGYIVFIGKEDLAVSYYSVPGDVKRQLADLIDEKIEWISHNPGSIGEDDRCVSRAYLDYNIRNKYPHPEQFLKSKWKRFETTDYSDDEMDFPIAKILLHSPEVKKCWMKMHQYAPIKEKCPLCEADPEKIKFEHIGDRSRIYCTECGVVYNEQDAEAHGFYDLIQFWNKGFHRKYFVQD